MLNVAEKMNTINKQALHFDAVIIGLGKTGLSCVRHLLKQQFNLAVFDEAADPIGLTTLKAEYGSVPVYLGEFDHALLQATDQIILSPGVARNNPAIDQAIQAGISVCGDIELFCQQTEVPIIAISGTNGKSTVTTLVAQMAQKAGIKTKVGGNLGTPVLDLLLDDAPELYVLELSSFQLETTTSLNAHASVVLNVSPDHLDRYDSLQDYIAAKQKIYAGDGLLVINQDDPIVAKMLEPSRQYCTFSLTEPRGQHFGVIKQDDDDYLCQGQQKIINASALKIEGQYNIANALAAMALADSVQVPTSVMAEVLTTFSGLPHRCEQVAIIHNVRWYNDSKATNIGSCIATIEGLCHLGQIILIAGGESKGADFSDLASVLSRHVKKVILLGKDANQLAAIINPAIEYEFVESMAAAVNMAHTNAKSGDLVLLAPACSSLDMFENYQHRGDVFVNLVQALETE